MLLFKLQLDANGMRVQKSITSTHPCIVLGKLIPLWELL